MKNDIQSTKPSGKPSSKALFDQTHPHGPVQKWVAIGKSWFTGRTSGLNYMGVSRADTSTMLKKHYQRAKRRKRLIKIAAVFGILFIVLAGVGTWFWGENRTFQVAILRAASMVVSIHVNPEMIVVPQGTLRQRESPGEDQPSEQPLRNIHITKFAIGQFEVTFEEYDRFAIATDRSLPRDEGWGRGSRPIINVSWEDARNYTTWLSQETGIRYRLPSETEWEYAARNGGNNQLWAGTSDEKQLSDYAWFNTNSTGRTQPVGTKKANGLGIQDMSGNVWEWVEDCWHEDYRDAPIDGAAWLDATGENCGVHVRRGGAWTDSPGSLHSSIRNWYSTDTRSILIGFRLARDID